MISRIERLLIALIFALFAAGITLVIASAQGEQSSCRASLLFRLCLLPHRISGNLGKWRSRKSRVVTCEACHGSAPADHPQSPMTIDRSPDLCIRCHSNTNFGVEDWKTSKHSQLGMDCATCHDPHSATLKKAAGPRDAHQQAMKFPNCASTVTKNIIWLSRIHPTIKRESPV